MSSLDHIRCTVLNASYEPLVVVSWQEALILVVTGKATVTSEHPDHIIHSAYDIWPVPTQVVLTKMVSTRPKHKVPAVITNRNLFIRDGYRCQYCLRHSSELIRDNPELGIVAEFLTRDHIFPQCLGGKDTWLNLVTACSKCNNKKADKLLQDCGLTLHKEPTVPTIFELQEKARHKKIKHNLNP